MPVRLTVSPRALGQGGIELQARASGEREVVPLGEVVGRIRERGA